MGWSAEFARCLGSSRCGRPCQWVGSGATMATTTTRWMRSPLVALAFQLLNDDLLRRHWLGPRVPAKSNLWPDPISGERIQSLRGPVRPRRENKLAAGQYGAGWGSTGRVSPSRPELTSGAAAAGAGAAAGRFRASP